MFMKRFILILAVVLMAVVAAQAQSNCRRCDGKGYEKCPEAPKYCFYGDKVCPRCDGLKKIPCPDCQ